MGLCSTKGIYFYLIAFSTTKLIQFLQTFTKWCNNHLRRRFGPEGPILDVDKVNEQFEDGINVFKLIHALYGNTIPKHNANPKMRPHMLDNLTLALKMIEDAGIKTHFLKTTRNDF